MPDAEAPQQPMTKIEIIDYKPSWPSEFQAIALELRAALGSAALRIDHIGSTCVPQLAAKDVIDIQISVPNIGQCDDLVSRLTDMDFAFLPQITNDNLVGVDNSSPELRKLFLRQPEGRRRAHVHIREEGRLNQVYALLFRDFLRSNSLVRKAYDVVKRELAHHFPDNPEAYYAIKDPYMDTVYRAALIWKDSTGWKPDGDFR
jgi:GrpB-like predicted nucleotidyltransferase (UPF0157 family)